jgi:transaldolase
MRHHETNPKNIGRRTERVWLDFMNRNLVHSVKFKRLIDRSEITGILSNAEALASCISGDRQYQGKIRTLARSGMDAEEIYRDIVMEDVKYAADLLLPVFRRTRGQDGFVGVAVSPEFAYDVEALLEEGYELWSRAGRPNLMIQIPATAEAVPAIRSLLQGGINVNATLLYSLSRYREVAQAYIAAMTERLKQGASVEGIASAATFSRHPRFHATEERKLTGEAPDLLRDISASTARLSSQLHRHLFENGKFLDLAAMGAQPQLLMWHDETDSLQAIDGFGSVVDLSAKFSESTTNPDSTSEEENIAIDWLLDLFQEETIKHQVVEIDAALQTMQGPHSI